MSPKVSLCPPKKDISGLLLLLKVLIEAPQQCSGFISFRWSLVHPLSDSDWSAFQISTYCVSDMLQQFIGCFIEECLFFSFRMDEKESYLVYSFGEKRLCPTASQCFDYDQIAVESSLAIGCFSVEYGVMVFVTSKSWCQKCIYRKPPSRELIT